MRQLKYSEKKLLRKVDFITYKQDNNHRDHDVSRRYMLKPEQYHSYNRLAGVSSGAAVLDVVAAVLTSKQSCRQLAHRLSLLPPENPVRRKLEQLLLDKLYDMGVLSSTSKLSLVEKDVTVSVFARRRLPLVWLRQRQLG